MSDSDKSELWSVALPGAITLEAAASEVIADLKSAHMLAYAPDRHVLCNDISDQDLAPDAGIYEARLFTPEGELRWQRDYSNKGTGTAVYLCTSEPKPKPEWGVATRIAYSKSLSGEYLLEQGGSLCYEEYIGPAPGEAGKDGNMTIVEQRLLSLKGHRS